MKLPSRRSIPLLLGAMFLLGDPPARGAGEPSPLSWPARPVPLSGACERMLRDEMASGLRLPPAIVRRFHLDVPEGAPEEARAPEPVIASRSKCGLEVMGEKPTPRCG